MTPPLIKFYRNAYHYIWHVKILKNFISLPKKQSIFTVYNLFPINGVKVVRNTQPLLRQHLSSKPIDVTAVHFLGAPFVERDKIDQSLYFSWLSHIKNELPEGAKFLYLLHPRESDEFGAIIKKDLGIDVVRYALPYELELMRMESLPGVIASWFCTALDNLAFASTGGLKLISYRLPEFEILNIKPNQKPIFDAAEDFYRRHSGPDSAVEVREIPSLPQSVTPVVIEDPQIELASLVEVGGPILRVVRLHPVERIGHASPFVILNPEETIAMGLRRLLGEYYGISPNLSQLPDDILSFLDITDDVLQLRQNSEGKTLKRIALTFNVVVDSEKLIKFLSADNVFGYPGVCASKIVQEPKPTLADLCSAIPQCEQVLMPRSRLVGNALGYLDIHTLCYSRPQSFFSSIKISLVIEDELGRVLMAERRSFPSHGQFDLPSVWVAPGYTLDTAFGQLTRDLLGSEILRLQAHPIVGFEQLLVNPEPSCTNEYILNFVYKIDVPNKHFVSMKATEELVKLAWWEVATVRKAPVVSANAIMALDFYKGRESEHQAVES
jgi:hypothetical protein